MKYILLIYNNEQALKELEQEGCYEEAVRLTHQLKNAGQYLGAAPLFPTSTATTVRVRGGKRLVTDGPYAETKEQLGGFFLIQAKDLDEAIDIAGRIPVSHSGVVEIRPVREIPGL